MSELHVVPDGRGRWRVFESGTRAALSEHTSATDAEFAAHQQAVDRAVERVVVHDRYHRTHDATASLALLRASERRAQARRLDAVRDTLHRFTRTDSGPEREQRGGRS